MVFWLTNSPLNCPRCLWMTPKSNSIGILKLIISKVARGKTLRKQVTLKSKEDKLLRRFKKQHQIILTVVVELSDFNLISIGLFSLVTTQLQCFQKIYGSFLMALSQKTISKTAK